MKLRGVSWNFLSSFVSGHELPLLLAANHAQKYELNIIIVTTCSQPPLAAGCGCGRRGVYAVVGVFLLSSAVFTSLVLASGGLDTAGNYWLYCRQWSVDIVFIMRTSPT